MTNEKWIGKEIQHKDITDSTNRDIKELARNGAPEGVVVCADLQTAGRGRRGRSWVSEKGDSLLFSLLLRPGILPDKASQITLLMALAVTKVLREEYGLDAKIKWPNDIVVGGKKVCGILTELYPDTDGGYFVIVGCGINVGQKSFSKELRDMATSMVLEKGTRLQTDELLKNILGEFEQYYKGFLPGQNLAGVIQEYNEWLVSRNREVCVLDPKGDFIGISEGINENGELLVQKEDGSLTKVYAGEVSVRGLYGYV